jgi:hypothetical protein
MIARAALTVTTVAILIGPSAILFEVRGHPVAKLFVIMTFTLLFSLAVSLFTKAKRHEMLAATAA